MKTIINSVIITVLCILILGSAYTIVGLILNFWNESIANASIGFMSAVLIGTISFAGVSVLIDKQKQKSNMKKVNLYFATENSKQLNKILKLVADIYVRIFNS